MRRTLSLTAAVAAVSLTATACLGSNDDDGDADTDRNVDATEVHLTIAANAVAGGKNEAGARWIEDWVIPNFVADQEAKGVTATVEFIPDGADDEDYKRSQALDLNTGGGADVIALDGIWIGEFADAGYIKPLAEVAGADAVNDWDGWSQIPEAVQGLGEFDGERYGVPMGTDGRVLYFNKELFDQAGLPADWQPTSWADVLGAAEQLATLDGVIPIQLNAGDAMGEATTMQGVLPLLVGTGMEIHDGEQWLGGGAAITNVLSAYQTIYGNQLGDPLMQQEAQGRDKSFQLFAEGRIGILLEGDYLWRGVLEPTVGVAKMDNRDEAVGWAKIPAMEPGAGVRGQDFVSMSGGGARVLNPNTEFPQQAWELLQFMTSAEAIKAELAGTARVTARMDVNAEVLTDDPLLSFIADEVLPITSYRPGLAEYPEVSAALQQATSAIVSGRTVEEAVAGYQQALESAVGADNILVDE